LNLAQRSFKVKVIISHIEKHMVRWLVTMLAVDSSEAGRTETGSVYTLSIPSTGRVLTLRLWYIALLALPAGVADTPP